MASMPAERVEAEDEPSAAWGWHGGFPRGGPIAGWVVVVALLAMLNGNHTGRIEDVWLIGIAALLAGGLIRHSLRRHRAWRR